MKNDTCWSKTQPVAWPRAHCSEYLVEANPAGCCYHQRQSICRAFPLHRWFERGVAWGRLAPSCVRFLGQSSSTGVDVL
jgi:hypothetical protein